MPRALDRNVSSIVTIFPQVRHCGVEEVQIREFLSADAQIGEGMTRSIDVKEISILFVCLGNICRSPTAAGVLRQVVGAEAPHLEVFVDSAGTSDYHIGRPPDERAMSAARSRGVDLSASRARQVTAHDFQRFDFILAMDRSNLRDLQVMRPAASKAELGLFLEYAGEGGDLEVPDPYYGGSDGFERVLDLATQASRGLIEKLSRASQPKRRR